MALIYVTGNSGTGKSTVREELRRRGYEAHDSDEHGMSSWRDKTTGEVVDRPDDPGERTSEWYAQHDWVASARMVERLADRAVEPVFLCGSPSNDDELLGYFTRIVCLVADEPTLRLRLTRRTNNDFGKTPDELAAVLSWHGVFEDDQRRRGAVMIDARRPLANVVDDVVDAATH